MLPKHSFISLLFVSSVRSQFYEVPQPTGRVLNSAQSDPTPKTYSFTITGPSIDENIPWGVNTRSIEDPNDAGELFSLEFNRSATFSWDINKQREIIEGTSGPERISMVDKGTASLVLGFRSNLTTRSISSSSPGTNVSTLPFGLNTGVKDRWNGSLTLNGYYGASRVNSTSWIPLHDAQAEVSDWQDFLDLGSYAISVRARSKGQQRWQNATAILAFYWPGIGLPNKWSCSDLYIEPIGPNSTYPIHIPGYLLSGPSRCDVREETGSDGVFHYMDDEFKNFILLGMPFFQAAYLYVEDEVPSKLYISQASDLDAPPRPEKFDASAQLQVSRKPESDATLAVGDGNKKLASDATAIGSCGPIYLLVVLAAALFSI